MQNTAPLSTIQSLTTSIKNLASNSQLFQAVSTFSLLRHYSSPFSLHLLEPILCLLSTSISLKSIPQSRQLHSLTISLGFSNHPYITRKLTDFYAISGLLSTAHCITKHSKDVSTWNLLISYYLNAGFSKNALNGYIEMRKNEIDPDFYTYPTVLKACGQAKDSVLGRKVHEDYVNSGLEWNLFVYNALIAMYARCGELDVARKLFDEMPERDLVSWNTMISCYSSKEMWDDAFKLFDKMRSEGVAVNCVTWNTIANMKLQLGFLDESLELISQIKWNGIWLDIASVVVGLNACSRLNLIRLGKEIHGLSIRSYMNESESVTNTLISMYSRCHHIDNAHILFKRARNRSIITWNSMLTGFAIHDRALESSMIFRELVRFGNEPNYITVVTILSLCARLTNLQHGRELHCYITKQGFKNYRLLWNSLVDMYSKAGKISVAQNVFDITADKDQVSYTSLITGYGVQGKGMKALKLFDDMVSSGIEPDGVSMVSVLSACSHSGLVNEGQRLFDCMLKSYGIRPEMEHYSCMVDLYSRAGMLEKAEEVLLEMPVRPSEEILAALLNACLIHKNLKIGERIANKLVEMETRNAGHYVLIANMYAAAGKWKELAEVRMVMKDRGVRKAPGCAWVDVGTGFSPFLVGDRSNELSPEIYLVLDGLIEQMRDAGYVESELMVGEFDSFEEHVASR